MNLVIDASALVATLANSGSDGAWAERLVRDHSLAAPELFWAEATNLFRRMEAARDLTATDAAAAREQLLQFRVEAFPFRPFAARIWELRHNLTSYDAWYVALAEALDCPLATLDLRLARVPGPRCTFLTPGSPSLPKAE